MGEEYDHELSFVLIWHDINKTDTLQNWQTYFKFLNYELYIANYSYLNKR